MLTDPIADLFTRIRNGAQRRKLLVTSPGSKLRKAIVTKLVDEGYLESFDEVKADGRASLVIRLKYDEYGRSVLEDIQRVSRPGRRMYSGASDIPRVRSGLGTLLVSTSRGILTGLEARQQNLGGELLGKVW